MTIGEIEEFEDKYDCGVFDLLRRILRGESLRVKEVRGLWPYTGSTEPFEDDPVGAHQAAEELLLRTLLPDSEAQALLDDYSYGGTDPDPDPSLGRDG